MRRFFSDKNGHIVIWQRPNAPFWAWVIASVLSRLTSGAVSSMFSAFATTAILIWASLELIKGQSPFRRVLGSFIFAAVIYQLIA